MKQNEILKNKVLAVTKENFNELALDIFEYQSENCEIYKKYINTLNINLEEIKSLNQIPFLPIDFFKKHTILSNPETSQTVTFKSSGTTGQVTSKHIVNDPDFYLQIATKQFEKTYQPLNQTIVLALLPSYLERGESSLVYMVQHFISQSGNDLSGFFIHDLKALVKTIKSAIQQYPNRKILLIGVTYALLDLAESDADLSFLKYNNQLMVMETGGMKGKRTEMIRDEVHAILKQSFYRTEIFSEYGMTELLSQAYSKGNGIFEISDTLKLLLREINDPFSILDKNNKTKTGGVNCIDLANVDSVSFIETKDLAVYVDESANYFKIIGRFDNSDQRGCNLMVQ
ncbi:MAG: acyl transferase [Pseudarcicella sp.]|nr:acyl transferase [Pseudarcicella sp.]MBP6411208.1 acyl transferase [Pseudarcicella sp.]